MIEKNDIFPTGDTPELRWSINRVAELELDKTKGRVNWVKRVGDTFIISWWKDYSDTAQLYVADPLGRKEPKPIRLGDCTIQLEEYIAKHFSDCSHIGTEASIGKILKLGMVKSPTIRKALLQAMPWLLQKEARHTYLPTGSNGTLKIQFGHSVPDQEICGGKYLATKPEDYSVIIQVRNDRGTPLQRKDWRVFLPNDDFADFPQDLRDWYEKQVGTQNLAFTIDTRFDGKIGKEGLEIFIPGGSDPIFADHTLINVDARVSVANTAPPVIVIINRDYPDNISYLQTQGEPSAWQVKKLRLPNELRFDYVQSVTFDPSGNFLLVDDGSKIHVLSVGDPVAKVGEIKADSATADSEATNVPNYPYSHPSFDSNGNLSVIRGDAIVFLDTSFNTLAHDLEQAELRKIAQSVSANLLFNGEKQKDASLRAQVEKLQPIVAMYLPAFQDQATLVLQTKSVSGVQRLVEALDALREELTALMPNRQSDAIAIARLIQEQCVDPVRREIYEREIDALMAQFVQNFNNAASLKSLGFLGQDYALMQEMIPWLSEEKKQSVFRLGRQLQEKMNEFVATHSHEFISQAEQYVELTRHQLDGFLSRDEMETWVDYDYPALLNQLGNLQQQCPVEAVDAVQAIIHARIQIGELVTKYEQKFAKEYAKVRSVAQEQNTALGQSLDHEIKQFIIRLKDRKFANRAEAERYVTGSPTFQQIHADIEVFLQRDPVRGKAVRQIFEVALSQFYYSVDQLSRVTVAKSGQQQVVFGDRSFPIWEGQVRERKQRRVSLQFEEDKATHGAGGRNAIMGDVLFRVESDTGVEMVAPYQGMDAADSYRLGLVTSAYGAVFSPSYVSTEEFKHLRQGLADWQKGADKSLIRRQMQERRQKLRELQQDKPKRDQFAGDDAEAFNTARDAHRNAYFKLLGEYAAYLAEQQVSLLQRVDAISSQPDEVSASGRAQVPEWQSHWVVDPQTEGYLEQMAEALQMQLELQEGMLLLKGHAGTGKDVLVKMFCEKTRRPYFSLDCSKWTTEFELSEDITLESVNGASQTVRVPSVVLNAITTPGAVLYFNEWNAMPEQAQLFLHSLLDEKRSLTLKTSSGKTIKVDPSVLIVGSFNPNYPGTFDIQFATRSRTVSLDIGYPPLKRDNDPTDKNKADKPFNVSEALRIARSVESLQSLTYEVDLSRNTFVLIWDHYVNHIDNNAPELSEAQKFDLDVILALVEFGNDLRQKFMDTFEKRGGRKQLEVTQPITAREMRRAAWALNQVPAEQKINTSMAEDIAKDYIIRFFVSHIDDADLRSRLIQHIKANLHIKRRTRA
jgi:MoxR-like ATPase